MAWDLATGKTKVGITDGSADAAITASMNAALKIAERYCDRSFMYAHETARFYDITADHIQLRRYPLEQVMNVNKGLSGGLPYSHVHYAAGRIMFHGSKFIDQASVEYAGGYRVLPEDLELALWSIFGNVWNQSYNAGGGSVLPTVTVGEVKRKTVTGVGSIEYTTSADAAGAASGGGGASGGLIPDTALFVLDSYRRLDA